MRILSVILVLMFAISAVAGVDITLNGKGVSRDSNEATRYAAAYKNSVADLRASCEAHKCSSCSDEVEIVSTDTYPANSEEYETSVIVSLKAKDCESLD